MGDNKIIIKNKIFHHNTIMLLGKTFSFTSDEANVHDLAKACDHFIIYSFYWESCHCVIYIVKNRRNINALIQTEFGKENVTMLRRWKHLEKKIANFSNHRRFNLRCISQNITSNSLKLKSNIWTSWGVKIFKVQRNNWQMNKWWSINNTIDICTYLRGTCMEELKDHINKKLYEECIECIKNVRESRHNNTLIRHLKKFNWLCHEIMSGNWNHTGGHSKYQQLQM